MNRSCLLMLALGACAASAQAQDSKAYRVGVPLHASKQALAVIDISDLNEPGAADTATRVFGYPGKRMGLSGTPAPRMLEDIDRIDRIDRNNRAWGISVGVQGGPLTFRIAHQNKNVARVVPSMPLGTRMDAKNSLIAAHVDVGPMKAYAAYSASRGWGTSPLWNPDNPYSAALASTPSTDSRDILIGLAMPLSRQSTLLTSFIRKNDRDVANLDAHQFAFGATYAQSRRTDFYAAYSLTQMRHGGALLGDLTGAHLSSALNFGMRHAF